MSKHETVYDCPFCRSEGHLYYNVAKRVFYCFKCAKGGNAAMLEREGMTLKAGPDGLLSLRSDVMNKLGATIQQPPKGIEPEGACLDYLTERGVRGTSLELFKQTEKGILCLFPDEDYWQERRWSAFAPPRWVNPTEAPREPGDGVTYHLRTHYDSRRIVLVEGIFDAIAVAPYGNVAAMLSSNYHDNQLRGLYDKGYRNATVMFDRDVMTSKRIDVMGRVNNFFYKMSVFAYQDADPAVASIDTLMKLRTDEYAL